MTTSATNDSGTGVWGGVNAISAARSVDADGTVHADAVHVDLAAAGVAEEALEGEDEGDAFEVVDARDDEPMHVAGRVFLGSVDAAVNAPALRRARIGHVLALLAAEEEEELLAAAALVDAGVARATLRLEDSLDEDLLAKLPRILDALCRIIEDAERRDENVLVHCVAGRSRSPAVVVAWLVAMDPRGQSVQDASDLVRVVRPWIDMNARFVQDLLRFHAVLTADVAAIATGATLGGVDWRERDLPRLDFDTALVASILSGAKRVTMRLESDVTDDRNSDLARIFPFSVVAATTGQEPGESSNAESRRRFALLRVDRVETRALSAADTATLADSGFGSAAEVLAVLRRFYPRVTMDTPLRMLRFQHLGAL